MRPSIGLISGVGDALINLGKWMLRHSMKIKYYTLSADELSKLSKLIDTPSWLWDRRYQCTDLEAWKKIIEHWDREKRSYKAEVYDCDNFSSSFSSFCSEIFDLNSAGITLGAVLDKNNNVIGYHAWTTLIVRENNKLVLYTYEPQGGADMLKKASKVVDMGWAKYRSDLIIWG